MKYMEIAEIIRANRFHFGADGIKKLADYFEESEPGFDRSRFYAKCDGKPWQPKTGAKCSCRPGIARDNCPRCEGTGMAVDFARIRSAR